MQIYLVRHGKTEFNLTHRFQGGQADSPLLAEGVEKAQLLGKYLANTHFKSVFSSPQGRALSTAQLITEENNYRPEIQIVSELREFEFGSWDGQTEASVLNNPQYQYLIQSPMRYDPQFAGKGETYNQFLTRTTQALKGIIEQSGFNEEKPVLIVAHGNLISLTVKWLLGVPLAKLRSNSCISADGDVLTTESHGIVKNDSLTIIETDNNEKYRLIKWNKTPYS